MSRKVDVVTRMEVEKLLAKGEYGRAAILVTSKGATGLAGDYYMRGANYSKAALAYLKAGEKEKAARAYEAGKKYDAAARMYERLNDTERAVVMFRKAQCFEESGRVLLEAEQYVEASQDLAKASNWVGAGSALIKSGDFIRAAEAFYRQFYEDCQAHGAGAVRADQTMSKTGVQAATLYEQLGNPKMAASIYAALGRTADVERLKAGHRPRDSGSVMARLAAETQENLNAITSPPGVSRTTPPGSGLGRSGVGLSRSGRRPSSTSRPTRAPRQTSPRGVRKKT